MERRRPTRATARRTTAGVAAVVAAGLGFALLGPDRNTPAPPAAAPASRAAAPLDESAAQRQAVRTGKRVEVTALRDATSTTTALPNGSFELTAHAAPIRAKVGGTWKPIDTTLVRTKRGWAPRATADPVVFSAGSGRSGGTRDGATGTKNASGTTANSAVSRASYTVSRDAAPGAPTTVSDDASYQDLVTLRSAGHEITMGWPGQLPAPEVRGATVLYRSVLDGVDMMLTAQDSGFTHVLVVHSPAAAAGLRKAGLSYRLTSPDLTFHLDPVTRAVTAQDSGGAEIAVAPTPYLWDSAGRPAVTEGPDPQAPEPTEGPAPEYSEEPGEDISDGPADPDAPDTDDTAAPGTGDDGTGAGPSSVPTAIPGSDETRGTAQQSAYAPGTTVGVGITRAAVTTDSSADLFTLPGLAGPQIGARTALGEAALAGDGTTGATLGITPDPELLTHEDTVWPVFIDPSISGHTKNWTTAYKKYPSSSFYDGANYNTGTTEARVGYESSTGGLSRSFFRIGWSSSIKGATVTSASIRLYETYAWSCSEREMQLWHTDGISSKTTWNNQPAWKKRIGTDSFAHGWNSTCPDSYVKFDGKSIAQDAADGGWTNFTIGLQASTEDSSYSWKKFKAENAGAPSISITYNRKPAEPTKLDISPGTGCDTTSPYASVGLSDVTFSARSSDPDGDLKYLDFEVWQSGASTKIYDDKRAVDSAGAASITIDGADGTASEFVNGKTYYWRVRALDSSGAASTYAPPTTANCGFVYDSSAPNSPEITSTDYPEDDGNGTNWSKVKFPTTGKFTFGSAGSKDTVKYLYSVNSTSYKQSVTVAAGASATVSIPPLAAGPNMLYAKASDASGNTSASPTKYLFYVTPKDGADKPGDVTGDGVADLYLLDATGDLRLYPATLGGDIHVSLQAAHMDGVSLEADSDEDGVSDHGDYWLDKQGRPSLITHHGDFLPGDGIQDLVARTGDGKLYIYRGDGYGSVDVEQRTEVRLPENAPAPSTFSQILAVDDISGDKRPELFATSGDALWAFSGYTGATFTTATRLSGSEWADRDLVNVGDFNKDGAADLVYRTFVTNRLLLRLGKADAGGGTSLTSLGSAANSLTGVDAEFGTGWGKAAIPLMTGTPDVTGDGIPDIWALMADGTLRIYKATPTWGGSATTVISGGWEQKLALG
ncbi:DNRLRE domain-containing protein [Streptomyces sp. NBC_01433]|uniref:DNRLRE domain-containing protein n=1 Tax=Streptomyces sp. NBC_01433 TaxID=2903864 RepID=UPI00225797AE|nr:DNRLRE domain-containing protein [Streptomyces sp. NBC_01433]MCX4674868.1 DNRLRE domain-containing protein [Streptomyces sp. NBC_01433]